MATLTGIIQGTGQEVQIVIPTVRIPELPQQTEAVEGADKIPIHDTSLNSTRWQSVTLLRDYILTGGAGAAIPPVLQGDTMEIIVDGTSKSGDYRVLVPALENKTFTLNRVGYGPLLTSQFLILPSGGFELVGSKVRLGDVFFASIFSPGSSAPGSTPGASTGSFINGIALISDDTLLSTAHYNKLLHSSSLLKHNEIILPKVEDAPANLIIPIETTLASGFYTKIVTQAGQFIYFGATSTTHIWMGANEFLWLLRGVDGWYVLSASESIQNVGQPFMDYVQRSNTAIAMGQLVQRSSVPRLVDWVLTHSEVYVTESAWQGSIENRGKFSLGDGATTIRMPDHQNQFYRGLANVGGVDPERTSNSVGNRQMDTFKAHDHTPEDTSNSIDFGLVGRASNTSINKTIGGGSTDNAGRGVELNVVDSPTPMTNGGGGTETRGKNVGLLPLIRT